MYFIEHLCDMATKENHLEFVRMIQRDILAVVDAVAPADGSGAANVKHVRRVLNGLQSKSVLSAQTVEEIDACLKERETHPAHLLDLDEEASGQGDKKNADTPKGYSGSRANGIARVDKRQIEQRIEEDRERNKRLRESMWAVTGDDMQELEKMWDEGSDIGEDDYITVAEELVERKQMMAAAQ